MKPPNMPTKSAMMVSSGSMTAVAISARRDQFLHRIRAQRAHGVDLLGDLHGAEFAGDAGGVAAGHHDGGEHRPEFADQGEGNDLCRSCPIWPYCASARDICSAMTAPLKKPIMTTIGRLPTPIVSICRMMSSP